MKVGQCHCKAVSWEMDIEKIESVLRCNCSFCTMRAAYMVSVPKEKLRVIKGEELLTKYQFHSKVAEHYFCSHCGIYTFHKKRSNPDEFGVNLGCIQGEDPNAKSYNIIHLDGQNHPKDAK